MDPRLYDVVASVAAKRTTAATDLYRQVIEDRVVQAVGDFARNYRLAVPSAAAKE